jgi:hypothetical protein
VTVTQLYQGAQMGIETYPLDTIAHKRLDFGGVQAGGTGTGVDFRAQAGDSQIGKRHPLAQTDNGQVIKSLQYK